MNLLVECLSMHLIISKAYLHMIVWLNEPRIRNDWMMSKYFLSAFFHSSYDEVL